MKRLLIAGIILSLGALAVWFDTIIIFLLSGFIPVINVTLAPSTMFATMVACVVLGFSLKRRFIVFEHCLELYDRIHESPETSSVDRSKPKLPRRRYQEL